MNTAAVPYFKPGEKSMNIPFKNLLLAGRIFLIASAFLFAGMLYFVSGTLSFKDGSLETEGTIVGYNMNDSGGGTDYYPVIEYIDTKGNTYRINSNRVMNQEVLAFIKASESGSTNPNNKIPRIKMRFSRANPEEARIVRSFLDLWASAIAYGVLAIIFSIIGTALTQVADTEGQRKQ